MRRSVAGSSLILLALVVRPASAQAPGPWSPRAAQPVESAGEIVLTFTSSEPGRIVYYTSDGDCSRYPLDPADCGRPQARASEDYAEVKGEWIFTQAGSRTIRITIFDDEADEADEAFTVNASRYDDVAEQTTWDNVIVHIVDDDPRIDSDDPAATTATTTASSPSGQNDGVALVGDGATASPTPIAGSARPNTALRPAAEVERNSAELQAGPGFELTSESNPGAAPSRRGGRGSVSLLPLGLGGTLLIVGTALVARRRLRWSATRA